MVSIRLDALRYLYFTCKIILMFYTDVIYAKLRSKHCSDDKYGSYTTIEAAQNACTRDNNCQGVYDEGCDALAGLDGIFLCPKNAPYRTSGSSCIYQKVEGKFGY